MTNEFTSILEGKSLADLRAIASQMGIPGCEKMRKTQIISIITSGVKPAKEESSPTAEPALESETPAKVTDEAPAAEEKPKTRKKPAKRASKVKEEPVAEETISTEVVAVAEIVESEAVEMNLEKQDKPKAKRTRKTKAEKAAVPVEEPTEMPSVVSETPSKGQDSVAEDAPTVEEHVTIEVPVTKARRAYSRRKSTKQVETSEKSVVTEDVEETAVSESEITEDAAEVVEPPKPEPIPDDDIEGVLEIMSDGYGFLRTKNYLSGSEDIYVSPSQIKRFGLRPGDKVTGKARKPARGEKFRALSFIELLNGDDYATMERRIRFENLTPIYPDNKLHLEVLDENNRSKETASRLLDIMAPIGRGQRGLIVSPPKAGKTELLKKIAHGITTNHPDVHLIVLLIDERPEEVTDMQRSIKGEIVYSTFDEEPEHHVKAAEMVMEHAKRMVEQGKDVVILMDSLTRLTRAYNLTITNSGRTMSGGMDTGALIKPKKFLGAARNIEFGGSLTIIATALVDTGSKMDDLIYEEFKGTGNLEIHLDRKLSERRIFPAIDIYKSGTRRDDLLLTQAEKDAADKIRRAFSSMGIAECTEMVINQMLRTPNNSSFLMTVKV